MAKRKKTRDPSIRSFVYHDGDWVSEDYVVWIQGRLLHGEVEWGARYKDERPFLTQVAGSRLDAIEVCQDHAEALANGEEYDRGILAGLG